MDDGSYMIDGQTTLEELEELFNIHFECEDIDTINGYMIYKLGKIPEEQEQFQMECGGYLFEVAEVAEDDSQSQSDKNTGEGADNRK